MPVWQVMGANAVVVCACGQLAGPLCDTALLPNWGAARALADKTYEEVSSMSQMMEIRWHGRAGQGVVTAGELLAEASLEQGNYFQAFPEYGSERMGAPIKSYNRISDEPVEVHSPVLEPDMVIIVNPNLIGVVDLTEGLKSDGYILMTTPQTPAEIRQRLGYSTGQVWCVDASRIAMEEFKRDIPSTMMIGVVCRATGIVNLDTVVHLTRERLGGKLRPEVVEANVRTLQRAYDEAVQG